MRLFLILALLCSSLLATAQTWSLTQQTYTTSGSTCSSSSNTCTLTITSTGTGHVGVILETSVSGSVYISTVVDNGSGSFWQVPTAARALSGASTDSAAYALNLASGATTVTVTWTNSTPGAYVNFGFFELVLSSGTAAYDTAGGTAQSTTTPQTGQTLTLNGTNDFIIQGIAAPSSYPTAVSTYSNYNGNCVISAHDYCGTATLLNSGSGTAPSWTMHATSTAAVNAIAFCVVGQGTCTGIVSSGHCAACDISEVEEIKRQSEQML